MLLMVLFVSGLGLDSVNVADGVVCVGLCLNTVCDVELSCIQVACQVLSSELWALSSE